MNQKNLLEHIIFSENFDRFHYMNNFQKSLCPADINVFFELAGVDFRVEEFVEADLSSIRFGEMRPDKIGFNGDTKEYAAIEFESTKPSEEALYRHGKYIANHAYKRRGANFTGISISTSKTERRTEIVDYGNAGKMYIEVVPYYSIDGDELLKIVKSKNKHNIPLNIYDNWFLGFGIRTKYSMEEHEMLLEIAKLTNNRYLSRDVVFEIKLANAIYCLDNIDEKYQKEIMEELNMNLALTKEAFRAVRLDGEEEGEKKGEKKMLKNIVLNMVDKGVSDDEIMELANISKEKLYRIKND